ncbi:hypothetical protein IGI04_026427 [Brassica rapa subsp. trilocularis]|uniref:Uncharacterized protein n=1 Tax=Brassica rapa subsp. trilocularis TaxID=1813537 RepID=A0ABQ7KW26_BRACM|nr:hypothetical protein IGI04_026427 [Brassica rapa subsp. trilocularis]
MMFLLLLLKVVQLRLLRMELRQNLGFIAAEYETILGTLSLENVVNFDYHSLLHSRILLWSGSRNVALEIISFGLIMYRVIILGKRKMCTHTKHSKMVVELYINLLICDSKHGT